MSEALKTLESEIAKACEGYTISNRGTIANRGKFEGDPTWVVYLWNLTMDGNSDIDVFDGDTLLSCFLLDESLALVTGLKQGHYVYLWETEQGFVSYSTMDQYEMSRLESAEDSDDESDGAP